MTLDLKTASAQLQMDPAVYLRILGIAVAQVEEDIGLITKALDAADIPVIQAISHRWKGDFANMRLDSIAGAAKMLNDAAKAAMPVDELGRRYEVFLQNFAEVKSALVKGARHEG